MTNHTRSLLSETEAVHLFNKFHTQRPLFSQCLDRGHRNLHSKIMIREIRQIRSQSVRERALDIVYVAKQKRNTFA